MNAISFDQSLTKYRPDQARDEQGQWTDEGGGATRRGVYESASRLGSGSGVKGRLDNDARERLQAFKRRLIDGPKKKSDIERLKRDVASYLREMRRINRASASAQEWTGKPGPVQYSQDMIEALVQLHAEASATKPQRAPTKQVRTDLVNGFAARFNELRGRSVPRPVYGVSNSSLPAQRHVENLGALSHAIESAKLTKTEWHALARAFDAPIPKSAGIKRARTATVGRIHNLITTWNKTLSRVGRIAARAPAWARKAADIQLPADAINFVRREAKLAATDLVTSLQALPDREKLLVAEALITGFHRVLQDLTKPPPKGKPEKATKYDPNQPRAPSGNPEGGQWTAGGVAGAAASAAATGGGAVLGAAREALSTVTLIPSSKTTVMDALSEWWSRFSALDDRDGKTSMEATVDAAGRIFMTIILGGAMILLANAFLTSAAGAVGAAVGQVLRVLIQR